LDGYEAGATVKLTQPAELQTFAQTNLAFDGVMGEVRAATGVSLRAMLQNPGRAGEARRMLAAEIRRRQA
jgi:hypothetical protein